MALVEGPRCNRQVTCDALPKNARSECSIAVNPTNPLNLVAASKRFTDPTLYEFSVAAYCSFDGGISWNESVLTKQQGWDGLTDPVVVFDAKGTAYLVALPIRYLSQAGNPGNFIDALGVAVYRSWGGGKAWSPATMIDTFDPGIAALGDDKPWAAADSKGNVFVVWQCGESDGSLTVRFATTFDGGQSWVGTQAAGAPVVLFADRIPPVPTIPIGAFPQVFVDGSDVVHIVYISDLATLSIVSSTDGLTFSNPTVVASNIHRLDQGGASQRDGRPVLPNATFRVGTFPTGCAVGQTLLVAWEDWDFNENRSRIQTARFVPGEGWAPPVPLLWAASQTATDQHEVFPQLAVAPDGTVGCAFYLYSAATGLIDTTLAASSDAAGSFRVRAALTSQPFDPAVDAPNAERFPDLTFIGDYFGLAASRLGFFTLWTDTRTGVQELFCSRNSVNPTAVVIPERRVQATHHFQIVPDAVVRQQPDVTYVGGAATNFTSQHAKQYTDSYIYALVTNKGGETARNVTLAGVVCSLALGITYPYDLYAGDWPNSAGHIDLGATPAMDIPPGATQLFGPLRWRGSRVPFSGMHPTIVLEARCDNDDSGGAAGACVPAILPGTCPYAADPGRFANVAILQPALDPGPLIHVPKTEPPIPWPWPWPPGPEGPLTVEIPFVVGGGGIQAAYLEILLDKGAGLSAIPMALAVDEVLRLGPTAPVPSIELRFIDPARVLLTSGGRSAAEVQLASGSSWRPSADPAESVVGGERVGRDVWRIDSASAAVGFSFQAGETRRMRLAVALPRTGHDHVAVDVAQRLDRRTVLGRATLVARVPRR
jgi:hypothetical protein